MSTLTLGPRPSGECRLLSPHTGSGGVGTANFMERGRVRIAAGKAFFRRYRVIVEEDLLTRVRGFFSSRSAAPLISIVIPIYNKGSHVEACLTSVLSQTGVNIEVFCIDDCSTDGSLDILKRIAAYDTRVKVVKNSSNRGAGYSRNVGIDLASGQYIQFTDADDLLPTAALSALHKAAAATGAEVIRGVLQSLPEGVCNLSLGELTGEIRIGPLSCLPQLWIPWYHVCLLISRELLVRGGIRYPHLIAGEDAVFMASVLAQAKKICVVPEVTYTYRLYGHRPRPLLKNVQDYLEHAEMVKNVYGDDHHVCWQSYGPFIKPRIAEYMSQAELGENDFQTLQHRLNQL
jgi:glycosyltransferase involved in cell wall biosynthesis